MLKHLIGATFTALALAACGEQPPERTAAEPARPGQLPDNNLFKPYTDSLERARGLEQTLQEGVERQHQVLDAQEN